MTTPTPPRERQWEAMQPSPPVPSSPPVDPASSQPPLAPQQPIGRSTDRKLKEHHDFEYIRVRGDKGSWLALGFLLAVVGTFIALSLYAVGWIRGELDPPGPPGSEVVVALGVGESSASIGGVLEELGIIENATVYSWYVRLKGGAEFQAGEFTFQKNSSASEAIEVLRSGPTRVALASTLSVTLVEGLTVAEIAESIDRIEDIPFDGEEFLDELRSGRYRSKYGPEPGSLGSEFERYEGLLFPDTYSLFADAEPATLILQLIATTDAVGDRVGLFQADRAVGLTPYEVIIVASLIEREAKVDDDRPKIARVIYNRLTLDMPLGIDATIAYFTGDNELTRRDLDTESPFNTRLVKGLPPTPIATPSEKSIRAALSPARGEWLYYVLTDEDGTHSFSETEEEFLANKQICQDKGLCG